MARDPYGQNPFMSVNLSSSETGGENKLLPTETPKVVINSEDKPPKRAKFGFGFNTAKKKNNINGNDEQDLKILNQSEFNAEENEDDEFEIMKPTRELPMPPGNLGKISPMNNNVTVSVNPYGKGKRFFASEDSKDKEKMAQNGKNGKAQRPLPNVPGIDMNMNLNGVNDDLDMSSESLGSSNKNPNFLDNLEIPENGNIKKPKKGLFGSASNLFKRKKSVTENVSTMETENSKADKVGEDQPEEKKKGFFNFGKRKKKDDPLENVADNFQLMEIEKGELNTANTDNNFKMQEEMAMGNQISFKKVEINPDNFVSPMMNKPFKQSFTMFAAKQTSSTNFPGPMMPSNSTNKRKDKTPPKMPPRKMTNKMPSINFSTGNQKANAVVPQRDESDDESGSGSDSESDGFDDIGKMTAEIMNADVSYNQKNFMPKYANPDFDILKPSDNSGKEQVEVKETTEKKMEAIPNFLPRKVTEPETPKVLKVEEGSVSNTDIKMEKDEKKLGPAPTGQRMVVDEVKMNFKKSLNAKIRPPLEEIVAQGANDKMKTFSDGTSIKLPSFKDMKMASTNLATEQMMKNAMLRKTSLADPTNGQVQNQTEAKAADNAAAGQNKKRKRKKGKKRKHKKKVTNLEGAAISPKPKDPRKKSLNKPNPYGKLQKDENNASSPNAIMEKADTIVGSNMKDGAKLEKIEVMIAGIKESLNAEAVQFDEKKKIELTKLLTKLEEKRTSLQIQVGNDLLKELS